MKISLFTFPSQFTEPNKSLAESAAKLNKLITAANAFELPEEFVTDLNAQIENLGLGIGEYKPLLKQLTQLNLSLEKDLRERFELYSPNYHRGLWMGAGMAAFGIPFGLIFSTVLKNFGFLGVGLPIGLSIGLAIGTAKDQKIKEKGRQLSL